MPLAVDQKHTPVEAGDDPDRLPPVHLGWAIWGLGAIFYLLGFYLRVAQAVIARDLMIDFDIGAAALGNLSAFYFYSYAAMQIPTGILADSWGPRRLLAWGALLSGVGTLCFALAPTITWAYLGRFLMGGATAVAFVGTLKLAAHWIAPRQFSVASGMALLVGTVGGVFAGVPLQLLVSQYGWRSVMGGTALLFFVVGAAIWWLIRDDPQEMGYASHAHAGLSNSPGSFLGALRGVGQVFGYHNARLFFFIPGSIVGSILTFAGLWGVPFLTTHYHLPDAQAAALCTTLLVSWSIGSPLLGALSDRIGRRKPLLVLGCGLVVLGWSILIFTPNLPVAGLIGLIIFIGLASGSVVLSYAYVKESVPPRLGGTALGVLNMGIMLGPVVLQPAIGWLLDQNWQGQVVEGARVYGLAAYQVGFSVMVAWLGVAFVLLFFSRETGCRQLEV